MIGTALATIEAAQRQMATAESTVRVLPDGRMDRENAAKYLGYKPKTLAMWDLLGKGPPSFKVGGRRFYWKDDLDAFIRGGAAAAA